MVTLSSQATQRVVLHDVSWALYEQMLATNSSNSAPRFMYDRGTPEIMSPGETMSAIAAPYRSSCGPRR